MCEARDFRRCPAAGAGDVMEADVDVVTSGGRRIPAHSSVLGSASPVLESVIQRRVQKGGGGGSGDAGRAVVRIRGVTDEAAAAFVRLLYAGRYTKGEREDIEKHTMHMLVLAHAYQVPQLKRACQEMLATRVTTDSVVDLLQLARLCDAPHLYMQCMKLLAKQFKAVEKTEAWRFLQENDPWQELEILQHLHDADLRRKRWRRKRAEQGVYMELNEAMDCLRHICTEGCTEVGPLGRPPAAAPCSRFETCQGLQLLIRHFSKCHRKSCPRCQRMWQLLRLHSALCDQPEPCNTPLCRQFKRKEQERRMEGTWTGDNDEKWGLLVKKVMAARLVSSLNKRRQMS